MFFTEEERKLTIEGCRFCPMCFHADTVAAITCKESNSPRGRGLILDALDKGVLKWEDPVVADVFYKSFTDGLPREWCAGHYDHDELVIDTRHRLIEKGLAPQKVMKVIKRILETGSPYASPGPTTTDFLQEAGLKTTEGANLLVYLGCSARSQYQASVRSFLMILKNAGVPFDLLAPEVCCGMPLYLLGDFTHTTLRVKQIADAIGAKGSREIVLLDAECYRMFSTRYARFGGSFRQGVKIVHVSEWMLQQIKEGKLRPKRSKARLTYHDPCSLARFTNVHEAPRQVLTSSSANGLIEMHRSREKAYCCGGGGGMPFTYPEIAHEAAVRRYEHARAVKAEILIAGSPGCALQLASVRREDGPIVMDLVEWVSKTL